MAVEIDITPRPVGAYRIVVWTVGPAVERKYPRIEALDANVVVAPRCGNEVRLLRANRTAHNSMAWVGRFPQRGLGVIGFDRSFAKLDASRWDQRLEWIAPVQISGAVPHQLLAVWPLKDKARVTFKTNPQAWQAIQMMRLYRSLFRRPTVVAGDFGNNPMFHINDPNWDMLELVALLEAAGLTSVYHSVTGLDHGDPREAPTRFLPDDRGSEGHHVDYCFVPDAWMPCLIDMQIGGREVWARSGRTEEHVPLVFDFDASAVHHTNRILRSKRQSG